MVEEPEKKLYLWFAIWLLSEVTYFYLHSTHMIEWVSYSILSGCRTIVFQDNRLLLRWTWAAVAVHLYQGLKRKLDLPRNLVAVTTFLLDLWDFPRVVSEDGIRLTHWGLHDRITGPLFVLAGPEITSGQILELLLLISLA